MQTNIWLSKMFKKYVNTTIRVNDPYNRDNNSKNSHFLNASVMCKVVVEKSGSSTKNVEKWCGRNVAKKEYSKDWRDKTRKRSAAEKNLFFCVFYASSSESQCSGSKHKMGQFFCKGKSACEENTKNSGPKTTGLAKDAEM